LATIAHYLFKKYPRLPTGWKISTSILRQMQHYNQPKPFNSQ